MTISDTQELAQFDFYQLSEKLRTYALKEVFTAIESESNEGKVSIVKKIVGYAEPEGIDIHSTITKTLKSTYASFISEKKEQSKNNEVYLKKPRTIAAILSFRFLGLLGYKKRELAILSEFLESHERVTKEATLDYETFIKEKVDTIHDYEVTNFPSMKEIGSIIYLAIAPSSMSNLSIAISVDTIRSITFSEPYIVDDEYFRAITYSTWGGRTIQLDENRIDINSDNFNSQRNNELFFISEEDAVSYANKAKTRVSVVNNVHKNRGNELFGIEKGESTTHC